MRSISPMRTSRAGFMTCPFDWIRPSSQAFLAMVLVLKNRAAQSQESIRTLVRVSLLFIVHSLVIFAIDRLIPFGAREGSAWSHCKPESNRLILNYLFKICLFGRRLAKLYETATINYLTSFPSADTLTSSRYVRKLLGLFLESPSKETKPRK